MKNPFHILIILLAVLFLSLRSEAAVSGASGTTYVTNIGVTHANIYVDPIYGNDATAVRNSWGSPYATLSAGLSNALSGDLVVCRPGTNFVKTALIYSNGVPGLRIVGKQNIRIEGNGLTLLATNWCGEMMVISNSPGTYVRGLTFIGWRTNNVLAIPGNGRGLSSPNGSVLHAALRLQAGCSGTILDDLVFTNIQNHAIGEMNDSQVIGDSTNIVVRNCRFYRVGTQISTTNGWYANGMDGAAIVTAQGWEIYNNYFEECAFGVEGYPITFRTNAAPISVHGNKFFNVMLGVALGQETCTAIVQNNLFFAETNYTWFANSSLSIWSMGTLSFSPRGIAIDGSSGGHVVMNNYIHGYLLGFGFTQGPNDGLFIDGNVVTNCYQGSLLTMYSTPKRAAVGWVVSNNKFDRSRFGNKRTVEFYGLADSVVRNNWIAATIDSAGDGVAMFNCTNVIFAGNTVLGKAGQAVNCQFSSNMKFFNNDWSRWDPTAYNRTVFSNDAPGIVVSDYSLGMVASSIGNAPAGAPTIFFGTTNSPTFTTVNGSLYLSSQGVCYLRTNSTWIVK